MPLVFLPHPMMTRTTAEIEQLADGHLENSPREGQVIQLLARIVVAELQFRYNNRDNADIFGEAIRGC